MKHWAYYNEIDPYAAQWLRNLIAKKLIMDGEVDERSITAVAADDLTGFTRAHFFAGIGGWDYALRLTGWPEDRPVWTGSCPCQPFSNAGKRQGTADERHLWPEWFRLIRECSPTVVFGEQVEAAIRAGWLDAVSADLEAQGYAIGATVLGAHSAGAPHIRQRLWFVADTLRARWPERGSESGNRQTAGRSQYGDSALGDPSGAGFPQRQEPLEFRGALRIEGAALGPAGSLRGFWRNPDWIYCTDGKYRPVEPGAFPLANRVPGRVGRLRAYGNAIVPQGAAKFITAYMEMT